MDYTTTIDNVVHAGTQHRMHLDSAAVPTAVSSNDMNMLIWSMMQVLEQAAVAGKPFNPDDPTSYNRFLLALQTLYGRVQATEDVLGIAQVAKQAETDAGVIDTKFVTPKKLVAWVKQATETVLGMAKVATQAQTNAGTDDATIVTPKKLRSGFSFLLADPGYIVFPVWLGGFIIQWGGVAGAGAGTASNASFPIPFPNTCYGIAWANQSTTPQQAAGDTRSGYGVYNPNGFNYFSNASAHYLAWGR